MKKSLKPSRVQNWSLLGMKPMHRALVRRTLNQLLRASDAAADTVVAWQVEDYPNVLDPQAYTKLQRAGVLFVDRESVMSSMTDNDPWMEALRFGNDRQIRLLWHWALRGKDDLMWCTEGNFNGVVYDAASLRAWLTVCIKQADSIDDQLNALLQGIELPNLAQSG